jgi:hypothetical protein
VLLIDATRELRKPGPTAGPLDRTAYPEPPRGRPAPIVLTPLSTAPRPLPPLDEADPVLWKERHTGRASPLSVLDTGARWFGGLIAIIAVMLFVTGGWTLVKRAMRAFDPAETEWISRFRVGPPDSGGQLMTAAGVLATGLYLLPLSIGVTGSVAGERHRATLDSLLTTLLSRKRLLWSKVRAHTESGLVFGVGAVTAVGCGFGADGGVRLGLAAMTALASSFALVIALGAWVSVRSATPVRAFRHCLPAVVAAISLPILMRDFVDWENVAPAITVLTWIAGICAVAACVCWWRAGVELERGNG